MMQKCCPWWKPTEWRWRHATVDMCCPWWQSTWWSYSWLDGLGKWCKSDVIWCLLAIWCWVLSLMTTHLIECCPWMATHLMKMMATYLMKFVLDRIRSWWSKSDVSTVSTEGNEERNSTCAKSMVKRVCLKAYADLSRRSRVCTRKITCQVAYGKKRS